MKAAPARSRTLHSLVGKASVEAVDWNNIISLSRSATLHTKHSSSLSLPKRYTADYIAKEWLATFRVEVSEIPLARYCQTSDLLVTPIHDLMQMGNNKSFDAINTVPIPRYINQQRSQKPPPCLSC